MRDYVNALVRPAVESLALPPADVFGRVRVIEYQMSSNFQVSERGHHSGGAADRPPVTFVMPILKNCIFFSLLSCTTD